MTKQAAVYAFIRADGRRVYIGHTMGSVQGGRTNRFTDQLQALEIARALGAKGARLEKLEVFPAGATKSEVARREFQLIRSSIAEGHPLINKVGQGQRKK
jgi:hypothetical protein